MSPDRNRAARLLAVGLAQVVLLAAVLELGRVPALGWVDGRVGGRWRYHHYHEVVAARGFPVPWAGWERDDVTSVTSGEPPLGSWQEASGRNVPVAAAAVLAAACLPIVAAAALAGRRARRPADPPGPSRPGRTGRVPGRRVRRLAGNRDLPR